MKLRSNFDRYLEEQLKDPDLAERFKNAGEAWDGPVFKEPTLFDAVKKNPKEG